MNRSFILFGNGDGSFRPTTFIWDSVGELQHKCDVRPHFNRASRRDRPDRRRWRELPARNLCAGKWNTGQQAIALDLTAIAEADAGGI
jgi:hypothetical protein